MATYEKRTYLLKTEDPTHIGVGGYRLGRVDNSIIRETGTGIPKIPGTSLHGAIRAYAARLYENMAAAGQDHSQVENPDQDPICYTFGYIKHNTEEEAGDAADSEPIAYSGVVNIFDAQVLLFPVASLHGPLWVTITGRLADAGVAVTGLPATWPSETVLPTSNLDNRINLGWLSLPAGSPVTLTWPEVWDKPGLQAIKERIVLVHDDLFGHIVNSNLEVRTSVSIDPKTGAAKKGALFTYEALPRATWLTMDMVIDDYRAAFPVVSQTSRTSEPLSWQAPLDVAVAGLKLIGWLGVGGMGTRGFGRVTLVGDAVIDPFSI
ncbi:MAG: type III-B CRISPR module RAMP protein Cmr4 [Chloroflexi bacterium]|nr:type III-B CRISPR module RAMP protein Cmr4 [Chloroflexota bacterium]